jgi:hypothetical protein
MTKLKGVIWPLGTVVNPPLHLLISLKSNYPVNINTKVVVENKYDQNPLGRFRKPQINSFYSLLG